jgi:hypothetical protein
MVYNRDTGHGAQQPGKLHNLGAVTVNHNKQRFIIGKQQGFLFFNKNPGVRLVVPQSRQQRARHGFSLVYHNMGAFAQFARYAYNPRGGA